MREESDFMRAERRRTFRTVASIMGVFLLLMVVVTTVQALAKTPADKTCLSYGGGPMEPKRYQRTVPEGSGLFVNGVFDRLYCYPTTQRTYTITKQAGEGDEGRVDFVQAPSNDNVTMDFEMVVYFKLNTDLLREFQENIGFKTQAWTDEGWVRMLREYFRPQIDLAVQKEARNYDAQSAFGDRAAFLSIQTALASALPENINAALGDDYIEDMRIVLRKIDIPQTLKDQLLANKESEVKIKTKQNEILQAKAEAEAIAERQKALEGCQVCILYEAIKSGTIDFWVIPSGNNLTLQTPTRTP